MEENKDNNGWIVRFLIKYSGTGAKRMAFGMILLFVLLWVVFIGSRG